MTEKNPKAAAQAIINSFRSMSGMINEELAKDKPNLTFSPSTMSAMASVYATVPEVIEDLLEIIRQQEWDIQTLWEQQAGESL